MRNVLDEEIQHAAGTSLTSQILPKLNQRRVPTALPFTIRLARTSGQLEKAVNVRCSTYSRRLPLIAASLDRPENEDQYPDSIILLAESKETLTPLGTLRIRTNAYGPTEFERELFLPPRFQGCSIAHVSRLGVVGGKAGNQVKLALFKALYRYALATQIEWIMATGIPPRDRDYFNLQFEEVFPERGLVALPSSRGIPARLLAFNVRTAEQRWRETDHPLYDFMCIRIHDDIRIFDSVSGAWAIGRMRSRATAEPRCAPLMFDVPVI